MRRLIVLLILLAALPIAAQADILGVPVEDGQTAVTISGVKGMDSKVNTLLEDLKMYPQVDTVDMTDVAFSTKNKAALAQGRPDVHFAWTVKLGNGTYTTEDTVMDLDTPRGEAKLSEIAAALHALPNIKHVVMTKYRPTPAGMDTYLLSAFPDVQFDWTQNWLICEGRRIYLKSTDTAFSTGKGRQDPRYTAKQIWERIQYVPGLLAIDVGHNNVSDLSFLRNYPKLRRLIVIDSKQPVTDISVLAELPDLEYIELFMQGITDLTPLANHTQLLDLNLATNDITDLTPLHSCVNLQRLWISSNPNLSMEQIEAFKAAVPGCEVVYDLPKGDETGGTWRKHPHYDVLIQSFADQTYHPFEDSAPLTNETEAMP